MAKKKAQKKKRKGRGGEDARQRRKFARGGRIEAYTFGEGKVSKGFPW